MSRMMSLFRSKSGSSSVAASRMDEESNLDGIKLDDMTTPDAPTSPGCRMTSNQEKENVGSIDFPTLDDDKCSVSSTESSYTGNEIQHRNGDSDEELFGAVHRKIVELEKENENILLSLINVEITSNDVKKTKEIDGKSTGVSAEMPSGSKTISEEVVKVDSVDDLKRLLFEANTATIKSLHLNLLL